MRWGEAWVHPTTHVLWAQLSTDSGPQEPKLTDEEGTCFVVLWPLVLGVAPPDNTPITNETGNAVSYHPERYGGKGTAGGGGEVARSL